MTNLLDLFIEQPIPSSNHGKPATCGAYVIEHPNGIYVGSTSDLYRRKNGHKSTLKRGVNPNKLLQEAFNSDPSLVIKTLITEDRDKAYEVEQKLIDSLSSDDKLFNRSLDVRLANKGLSHTLSDETKDRMSQASPKKAHVRSAETREKLSIAHSGKVLEQHHRDSISQGSPMRQVVSVGGIEYPSMRKAGEALGMDHGSVRQRVLSNDPKYADWLKLDKE